MYDQRTPADVGGGADGPAWRPPEFARAANDGIDVGVGDVATRGSPAVEPGSDRMRSWWYVVVDELEDERCQLTMDPWPTTDADGRLRFDPDVATVDAPISRPLLAALVGAARARQGLPAADRAIRIGDVFAVDVTLLSWILDDVDLGAAWLRDPDADAGRELRASLDPGRRPDFDVFLAASEEGGSARSLPEMVGDRILDVTAEARDLAHAAADEAATGVLEATDVARLDLLVQQPDPPPGAGQPS